MRHALLFHDFSEDSMARTNRARRAVGPRGSRALAVLACGLGLAGCASLDDDAPYVWPAPRYGEPMATQFQVRYSSLRHTDADVLRVIAEQCGERFTTARVVDQPYRGTALHPQSLQVTCGAPPAPQPVNRDHSVDPGYLVMLPPATPSVQQGDRQN